ncbi:protein PERCC1 isoform 2-T2 [Sarcophilus harrisii]
MRKIPKRGKMAEMGKWEGAVRDNICCLGRLLASREEMAAGVIRNLCDFRLQAAFHQPFLPTSGHRDPDFPETSEEEEEDGEEEEEGEKLGDNLELAGSNPGCQRSDQNLITGPTRSSPSSAEMTLQLLRFSELISCDIQKYFGQKTKDDDPDACNIYEDCRPPGKSARELYYADLMQIVQSGDQEDEDTDVVGLPKGLDCPARFISSRDRSQKLGPLVELFEYGLCQYARQRVSDSRRLRLEKKYGHITPMHKRKLPQSFWKEPAPSSLCLLNTSTPDFSDLLANWTSDVAQELHGVGGRELDRQALEMDQLEEV